MLDLFVGSGTTLVEAKLLRRNIIGGDVNISALARCKEKCDFEYENAGEVKVYKGDRGTWTSRRTAASI
ncbi:MAG: site-specific DNA-methyltransferase [Oscillospiraceae bacterium]|nr:site-specific DNA-methyltransferase [Oscillospiraceae bacterium]